MNKLFPFLVFCCLTIFSIKSFSQANGFSDELYVNNVNKGVGFVCDGIGRFYVWEQDGRIWTISNGVKSSTPLIDLTDEIFPSIQMGLLGVVLDPDFLNNGYIYLYYSVDTYYEQFHGTPDYDPANLDDHGGNFYWPLPSIGRLTRYKVANLTNNFPDIDLNSRTILLGETLQTGVPSTAYAHIGGAMAFGHDGTLMLATGDGASNGPSENEGDTGSFYFYSAYQEALALGILKPSENIGSFRSQMDSTFSGKILRLDPATGNGIPSNPNFDINNPRSPQSRTWGKGLRNPFRMTFKDETGSHHPEDGNPGIFWLADVGRDKKEEVNLITGPNQNFGWPKYEGIDYESPWATSLTIPNNEYKRPLIDYRGDSLGGNNTQGRTWYNNDHIEAIGGSVVTGDANFAGADCSVGGFFYDKTDFPAQYQNSVFTADFTSKWIFQVKLDNNYNLISVNNFFHAPENITYLDVHPSLDGLFYLSGAGGISTQLRRLRYNVGNQPPVVLLNANPTYGTSNVNVNFDGSNSYDPEDGAISYAWDFGDGSPIVATASPTHTFTAANIVKYKVKLTVTDDLGLNKSDSIYISVNNTPPIINSTSLDNINTAPQNQAVVVTLNANVSDAEQNNSQLTYRWVLVLAHNGHEHVEADLSGNNFTYTIPPTACEAGSATYWQRVYLTVTDPLGLSATYFKDIFPSCGGTTQTINFPQITDKLNVNPPFQLNATASSGLPINYFIISGPANIIGNTLTLKGIPGVVKVRAVQHGNNNFDPALPIDVTFKVNKSPTTSQTVSAATLKATIITSASVKLDWAFTVGTYVTFDIVKDGVTVATVADPTYTATIANLTSNVIYKFVIVGKDAYGNKTISQNVFIKLPNDICSISTTFLSDMAWVSATNGSGPVELDKSNGGQTITLHGSTYFKGLGVHAASEIIYNLNYNYDKLVGEIGIDDEITDQTCASVKFLVFADGNLVYISDTMRANSATVHLDVNMTGVNELKLIVDPLDDNNCDHADWALIRLDKCTLDNIPPTTPVNLGIQDLTSNSFTVSWNPSTDNIGVINYDIYSNGILIGTTTNTYFNISGVANTQKVVIQAKDAAGNVAVSRIIEVGLKCAETVNLVSSSNDYPATAYVQIYSNETLTATNLLKNGAFVIYNSAKSITLNPGFQANAGSVFKAQIRGCN